MSGKYIKDLLDRLSEAEETLNAIRNAKVDAIIISEGGEDKLYTLTSAETPYRIIIEEMNEGAVTVSNKGIVNYCNKRFAELVNEPAEKITGSKFSRFILSAEQQKFNSLFKEGLKTRSNGEVTFLLKNNIEQHMYLSLSKLPPGMLNGVCIIATDITESWNFALKLKEYNDKLIKTQDQLIHFEKLASLGRFSSGIAHEIRNPLANISSLAQLLSKEKLFDKKYRQYINYILINTNIANRIIKDLLTFASPDKYVYKKLDITKILYKLVNIAGTRCRKNNIKLKRKLNKNIPLITVNEEKLQTAFLNLISNAIDAMPKGGTLTITSDFDKDDNHAVLSFEDTGIGIPVENLGKILEPFFTTKKEGTGLGLSLTYNVIAAHSGKIDIVSKVNKGTKFTIRLPVKQLNIKKNDLMQIQN